MTSLLLVKPDGVASAATTAAIDAAVRGAGLHVLAESVIRLSPADVDAVWPKFDRPAHRFVRAMLHRYLTSGPSKLLVVAGDDVIGRCLRVRSSVRDAYGHSAFENAVHTPADERERRDNLSVLAPERLAGRHVIGADLSAGPGAYGRLAAARDGEIEAIADAIWAAKTATNWERLRTTMVGASVTLRPGSDNSIDREVAILAETFPDEPLLWCAERFVEAEIFGSAVLCPADDTHARRRIDELSRQGVLVADP